MERLLQWLDDVDDLLVRLPHVLHSPHAQRLLTLAFFLLLGGLSGLAVFVPF